MSLWAFQHFIPEAPSGVTSGVNRWLLGLVVQPLIHRPSLISQLLARFQFAREYAVRGAAAYMQLMQRKERGSDVDTLTQQERSGSEMVDESGNIIYEGTFY